MPMSGGWVFVIVVIGILNTMLFIKIWRATNKIRLIEEHVRLWILTERSGVQKEEKRTPDGWTEF